MTVIITVVAVFGYRFAKGKLDDMTQEMKQLGFENIVRQQAIEVSDEITEPTLYMGQMVKILGDCSTDLETLADKAT